MIRRIESALLQESSTQRVGRRITALREALGMSKAELADAISLDRSTLTKVEKGHKGLDITKGIQISNLYGFGLDFIYRGDLSDVPLDLRAKTVTVLETLITSP